MGIPVDQNAMVRINFDEHPPCRLYLFDQTSRLASKKNPYFSFQCGIITNNDWKKVIPSGQALASSQQAAAIICP